MNWAQAKHDGRTVWYAVPVRDPDGYLPRNYDAKLRAIGRRTACGLVSGSAEDGRPLVTGYGDCFPLPDEREHREDFPPCAECAERVDATPSMMRRWYRQKLRHLEYVAQLRAGTYRVAVPVLGAHVAIGRNRIAEATN